jgi:predicted N-formylglutamate amidohydrolase
LLGHGDPSPVIVVNAGAVSPFLLLGDHAGRAIPSHLGDLGLPPGAIDLHIAWDIGVAGLGERLSRALDATFVRQAYSRLVIDCNRRPDAADSAPPVSDGVAVPANQGLSPADLAQRRVEIFQPYHDAIAAELDRRTAEGLRTLVVALHSFTPVMRGQARPWRYGVLHRGDSPLSRRVLTELRRAMGEAAGDNQPYAMDGTDWTIPRHADPRGLDYLELEVRQDLIADEAGQDAAADLIARVLRASA